MNPCFTDESLRRLGDDDLDPVLFRIMERHVEACPRCVRRLEALAIECPSLSKSGRSGRSTPGDDAPELDDFVIEGEAGRGAMGVVYVARDVRLGRRVALKVLAQPAARDDARRRWLREARALSSIRHPNVVSLHECREVGRRFVIVLEYVPGGSLKSRLSGPLEPRAAAVLMEKIARAAAFVHGQGVLHLDLKPSNILLDGEIGGTWEQAVPRIADFGMALLYDDAGAEPTQDGPRGTPAYMAPEQVRGKRGELSPAADVYALGVVLYELLTGRPPFRAASSHETMELTLTQEPVPLRRLNPRAPRDLETIVQKCLEKSAPPRYATAEELADDLGRWLDGRPIQARPASLIGKAWRVCLRHRAASFLCLILLGTVAASFGLLLDAYTRADAARHAAEIERTAAEDARSDAEQNFETAATVTVRLEDVMLDALNHSRPLDVEHLESAAKLLRDHVWRDGVIQGYKLDVLWRLSDIEYRLAVLYIEASRFRDALAVATEELHLIRACYAMDPTNVGYRRKQVLALHIASQAEHCMGQFSDALDHLDVASDLIRKAAPPIPEQLSLACEVSMVYLVIRDKLIRLGRVEEAQRAIEGHLGLMALFEIEEPGRPARSLCLAVSLADRGEPERAREVFARLMEGPGLPETASAELHEETDWAAHAWFSRDLTLWIRDASMRPPSDEGINDYCSRYIKNYHSLGLKGIPDLKLRTVYLDVAQWRREGRIEDAERTTALLLAIVTRFVELFPNHPQFYEALSEAFEQQTKNVWHRENLRNDKDAWNPEYLREVRRTSGLAIEMLQKAQSLAPNDERIRARIILQQSRLDKLPSSP